MGRKAVDALVVLLSAALLLVVAAGGIDIEWGVLRIRLHDWIRPLELLGATLVLRAWLETRAPPSMADGAPRARRVSAYAATRGLLALLLATSALYGRYHVRVAGGLDSYGYVSAASLLAAGRLKEPQNLVSLLPFDTASTSAAPLGYVPAPDGHSSSPRFPLGLPLVMAVFKVLGPNGVFFAPLVMGFVTMGLAYAFGREPLVPGSGLFAAAILAVDPLFAYYAIQPMSDVPAACWLLGALWLRIRRPNLPIAAGLCAGMAVLTRPALLIAAGVVGSVGIVGVDRERPAVAIKTDAIKFAVVLCAFIVLQMGLNLVLYGSATTSGYGPASFMFDLSATRLTANVTNFGKWLTYSHTPAIWLVWPVSLVVLRHRRWAWQVSAVAAAAALPYLFYLIFDDWESSRFLMPCLAIVLILGANALAVSLAGAARRLGPGWAALPPLVLLATALVCAMASHRFLEREGAFRFGSLEAKYRLAGEWFRTHTSERAVVFAGLHSGSIKLYGLRETIRWDQVPPGALGPTIHNLRAAGYEPYVALDTASEPPLFESRFAEFLGTPDGRLEPIARVRVVNIYRFVSAH